MAAVRAVYKTLSCSQIFHFLKEIVEQGNDDESVGTINDHETMWKIVDIMTDVTDRTVC